MATTRKPLSTVSPHSDQRSYAYYRDALAGRSLPAAFVDVDLLDENIAAIASRMNAKR